MLRLKFALELVEDPFVPGDNVESTLGAPEHRSVARKTAWASMTLLTNDGTLPLDSPPRFGARRRTERRRHRHQHDGWGHTAEDPRQLGDTVLEGVREIAPEDTDTDYVQGTTINEDVDDAVAAEPAADADVAVVALGEPAYVHEFRDATESGDTDEFPKRSQLRLPDPQRELAEAIHDTGTPTVGVLVTGRVLSTPWLAKHLSGLLMAYQLGSEGGAVADVLFGDCDPVGRLPVSVPRSTGDLPVRFNHLS